MKFITFLYFLLVTFSAAYGQFRLYQEVVYLNEKEFCNFNYNQIDGWTQKYEFKDFNNLVFLSVDKIRRGLSYSYHISFPSLNKYYEINDVKKKITDILYLHTKTHAIINDKLIPDMAVLENYAAQNQITLQDIPENKKVLANMENNSRLSGAGDVGKPDSDIPVYVSLSIKNNAGNTVKVFIGDKPKYGSGITLNLSGNSYESRQGKIGDQLCIVDDSGNPQSCITISGSMGTIYINKQGNGFGNN